MEINKFWDKQRFWWWLSLTMAVVYGLLALRMAFDGEYVVQDDARQHVFWMERFLVPGLFPGDLIADYFQSVAPLGYVKLYQLGAILGISPLLLNKLLPLPLGILTTILTFRLSMRLFPVPMAGFMASLILNQSLWMKDDLASATPRAFVYPLFLAFLLFLLEGSLLPCLGTIILTGLFYPQSVLVEAGILTLRLLWSETGFLRLRKRQLVLETGLLKRNGMFELAGLVTALGVMLPYVWQTSDFGPTISLAAAKELPEFWSGGRSEFFTDRLDEFWLSSRRSGCLPNRMAVACWFGLLLPLVQRYSQTFPLTKKISHDIIILPQITITAFTLFFAAHILLFTLHLPSRYTTHTLQIVLGLAAGICIAIITDKLRQQSRQGLIISGIIVTALILYPLTVSKFPRPYYKTGKEIELYQFFQQQPKDILIASIAEEGHFLPTFTQRSILVGREYAIPYHLGYYREFRDRTAAVIQAQYSPDSAPMRELIAKYGIDFWLLDRAAFTPSYFEENEWLEEYQAKKFPQDEVVMTVKNSLATLQRGETPALSQLAAVCMVWENDKFVVLAGECLGK
ncbi:MAG TPA: hypothetical protein IGS52_02765 [Oscillatoriaceae cyanobacterium M33_DOE_052]|uniref:Glycosyltransferase RgtA/B/C/D-like domain-containing protein n=1 Tax=Planktothricoides sp. SpSt-374 TaxID=2282167 RepID=A0A7C3ZX34_9CYAN|nr:hypothetical protein [Oscillatoriaceae cyanobacterium M33_DOE_052]